MRNVALNFHAQARLLLLTLLSVSLVLVGCAPSVAAPTGTVPMVTRIITRTPRPTAQATSLSGSADHVQGPENAFLTIAHYGDFTCEPCVSIARTLLLLRQRYPNDLRIIWRHFPASPAAQLAAEAAEAVAAQDEAKFWPLHDLLLARQAEWRDLPLDALRARLAQYADSVGADVNTFLAALDSGAGATRVQNASREAAARGFRSAPVLTFRDEPYEGRIDQFALENLTNLLMLEKRHFPSAPPLQINLDRRYTASLITEHGTVEIELFTRAAPVTVNNFVFLARQGWYNDITFHLVTNEIVQTGDPSGSGLGTAGYNIVDEFNNGLIFDREGMVAMHNQRGRENSGSSQFFISLGPLPPEGFNGEYTIFGQVTAGMDVLRKLTKRDPSDPLRFPNPPPGDRLIRVEIQERSVNE